MSYQEAGKAFLEHYGIQGMKWGVRRSDKELARARGSKDSDGEKKESGGDSGSSGSSGSRTPTSARALSDSELRAVVNRLNLEKQYAQLTALPPSRAERVARFMSDIAVNVARTQITAVANNQASKIVAKQLGNAKESAQRTQAPAAQGPPFPEPTSN